MPNYKTPDDKREVTMWVFDSLWHRTLRSWGGVTRSICVGVNGPSCPGFPHCLLFLILLHSVLWQADGSDYVVIINPGRKTTAEMEVWQWRSVHGPEHVSIGPDHHRRGPFPSLWRLRPTPHHWERHWEQYAAQFAEIFDHTSVKPDSVSRCFTLRPHLQRERYCYNKIIHQNWYIQYIIK